MAEPIEITPLPADQFDMSVAATSRAFWPDPMFGFFARNSVQEHTMLPHFISAVMGDSLRHGEVDVIMRNGRVIASASWLLPGDTPRSWKRELRISLRCARALLTGRNRLKGIKLLDAMTKKHPTEPHLYLGLLGVDPAFQGCGLGSALLERRINDCDNAHMPIYLETQKPENVPYYKRFGFDVREEIRHDGCPPLWTMWRDSRQP
jgi:GNAT superfamily N-acetyltransferase